MPNNTLLSRPTVKGGMRLSPQYNVMGVGLTDSILLIGHADAEIMYQPYQVSDMQLAINFLNADQSSPLLRALLECYNAGCKDIWLYAAAPMNEYEPTIGVRKTASIRYPSNDLFPGANLFPETRSFYQVWFDRLTAAYAQLVDLEIAEIIVPLEAVFYDAGGIDFASQLIDFCSDTFASTGAATLGILGTRIADANGTDISNMVSDSRLKSFSADGKFVMVAVGEGTVSHPQTNNTYITSLATQVAAVLATTNLSRSIAGLRLPSVSTLIGPNYTPSQLEAMTQAKLNPIVRSQQGKRGAVFQTKLLTDNTLGQDGTDFWSMAQMHMVANCINQIRSYGYALIGTSFGNGGFNKLREVIYDHMNKLVNNGYIRDYSLNIEGLNFNTKAVVKIGITPIFGIRNIYFQTEIGPGS